MAYMKAVRGGQACRGRWAAAFPGKEIPMQGRIFVVAASALLVVSAALPVRAAAPVCRAETFTETFSDGGNEGGWTIGGNEFIDNQKGKNKDFLHAPQLDTFYPIAL